MASKAGRAAIIGLALAIIGVSGIAVAQAPRTAAESIEYRHAQLRRLGAAFKIVNEQARAGTPDLAAIRASSETISSLAAEFPTWFPAGSGPGPGIDTHAKAEIWSDRPAFDAQIAQFQAAAQGLATASVAGDVPQISAAARAAGARCSSCHSDFRSH